MQSSPKPLFLLIDSNALIHRSFHAIPHLTASDGTPTNAVYGFTMTLLSAIKELQPTHLAAAFDVHAPTFRHIEFKEYKAHREKAPDELYAQIPVVKEVLQSLNIPVYEQSGLEADDIIGILSRQIKPDKIPVMIVTGDMDSLQLVDDMTRVYTLRKGLKDTIIYNPQLVKQRFGFTPDHLIDYKALRGDPSDNIPGVKGIGEKTACTLVQRFQTIEQLYDFLEKNPETKDIKPAIKTKLIEQKEMAFLSKKLATIITDQPLSDFATDKCLVHDYEPEKAIELFQHLGFKSLIPRLPQQHELRVTSDKLREKKKTILNNTNPTLNLKLETNNYPSSPFAKRAKNPQGASGDLNSSPSRNSSLVTSNSPSSPLSTLQTLKTCNYQTITTLDQLKKLLPKLNKGFTFDTETSDLDLFNNTKLVGISIAFEPHSAYYLPLNHINSPLAKGAESPQGASGDFSSSPLDTCNLKLYTSSPSPSRNSSLITSNSPSSSPLSTLQTLKTSDSSSNLPKEALELIKPIFQNPSIPKTAQNAKFDMQALKLADIQVQGLVFDTMLASYLINPNQPSAHKLDNLALIELGHQMIPITDLIGSSKEQISFAETPIDQATIYSCEDADITNQLKDKLSIQLKDLQLTEIMEKIELPLVTVLSRMEQNGILLDKEYLSTFNKQIIKQIKDLEQKIHELAGQQFNIASTQQLSDILFNNLHISTNKIRKTKTGISTAASELDKMKNLHPIIPLIQEFRLLNKLQNTYISTLPDLVKSDERIHTSYNQTITATGRLSSSNPNLQNIPIKSDIGAQIRRAFIAPHNHKLIAADYSQIELRLMAHIAKETTMIEAFQNNRDIHQETASKIYNLPLEQITPAQRYNAKTINFSLIYGAGARNISEQLNIKIDEAKYFIEQYFAVFPQIKDYMQKAIDYTKTNGYSKTLYGRRRPIPEIESQAPQIKAQAERIAVNTPIQGTAADIIKLAMINIHQKIQSVPSIKLLLQVHDELIFEVQDDYIQQATQLIRHEMENVCQLSIPLKVDIEIGQNWGEMEKIN